MSERAKATAKTSDSKTESLTSRAKQTNFSPSISSPIDQILFLQKTVGNQAVQGFLKSGVVQAKLTIGQPGNIYEQEADRIAEQVMGMTDPDVSGISNGNTHVRRKCAECSSGPGTCSKCAEEEGVIQRKSIASTITPLIQRQGGQPREDGEVLERKEASDTSLEGTSDIEAQVNRLKTGGQPLPKPVRDFFEPRFGYDFSKVRVHTGPDAHSLNRALDSRALTVGRDIVFDNGEYSTKTSGSNNLLSHELTHVVQQSGLQDTIQCDRRGTTRFRETVTGVPTETKPGIWTGSVEREEYIPATGTVAEKVIHTGTVDMRYDANTCTLAIPYKVKFEQPSASNWPKCAADTGDPVPAHTPNDKFDSIKSRFLNAANSWLNDWYTARVSNCEVGCANREIPIEVRITEDSKNPDKTVVIANVAGRSCVSGDFITLHVGEGIPTNILAHEAGHAFLGHGDEYPEAGEPEERVRVEDWSLMSTSRAFNRRSLLHERHFQFATEFLEAVYPGCSAELVELSRPPTLSFDLTIGLGGASLAGVGGGYLQLGLDLGIPLNRLRTWELILGARGTVIQQLESDSDLLNAFLIGARLGISHTFTPSAGGARLGVFGELGGGRFQGVPPGGSRYAPVEGWLPYGEVGIAGGYSFSPSTPFTPFLQGELAFGSSFKGLDFENAEAVRLFRLGIDFGFHF